MHKKLEAELVSLAHSILQMKNKDDIYALHEKAHVIYEKLSVLKFVEDYVNTTPQAEQNKEEILEKIEKFLTDDVELEVPNEEPSEIIDEEVVVVIEEEEEPVFEESESIVEQEQEVSVPYEENLEEPAEDKFFEEDLTPVFEEPDSSEELTLGIEIAEEEKVVDEASFEEEEIVSKTKKESPVVKENDLFDGQISLEDELQKAYEIDEATKLFEKVTKESPVVEEKEPQQQRSLNDALFKNRIQIGLNDRIAFVKHLFDNSQEDFNRVLSQLNSFKTEKEAKQFINKIVRPDYDWTDKEEYEERLMDLVERRFL
jgi:hypothetical protein